MHKVWIAVASTATALAASPAAAIDSHLVRTFVPSRTIDFDVLPLGLLAPDTVVAPGVVFAGAYPPFILGPSATVVSVTGGRALEIESGEAVAFQFEPPVEDVGAAVTQVSTVEGAQVSVYALDADGVSIRAFGYIYIPPTTLQFPEVTDATAPPITTFIMKALGGTYRVDDLDVPEPAETAAGLVSCGVLALRAAVRADRRRWIPSTAILRGGHA
jgi:hypothetical protein